MANVLGLIFVLFPLALCRESKRDKPPPPPPFVAWDYPAIPSLDGSAIFDEIIPENPLDGENILNIQATGPEIFSILEQDIDGYLNIDVNGTITVNSSAGTFDREAFEFYRFVVVGEQPPFSEGGGKDDEEEEVIPGITGTATFTVQISDVNDVYPLFSEDEYFFSLDEGTTGTTQVAIFEAIDNDFKPENGQLYYSIVGGNTRDDFYIGPRSGLLIVSVGHELDDEVVAYGLLVTATDSGFPALTSTTTVFVTTC